MFNHTKVFPAVILSFLMLIGCSNDSETNNKVTSTTKIADLTFQSHDFRTCLQKQAKANSWVYVGDVINLDCSNSSIVDISDSQLLVDLETLDVTQNPLSDASISLIENVNFEVKRSLLLSELDFQDPEFSSCAKDSTHRFDYEITELNCSGREIKSISDVALLPNLTYIVLLEVPLSDEAIKEFHALNGISRERSLLVNELDIKDDNFRTCLLDSEYRFGFEVTELSCRDLNIASFADTEKLPRLKHLDLKFVSLSGQAIEELEALEGISYERSPFVSELEFEDEQFEACVLSSGHRFDFEAAMLNCNGRDIKSFADTAKLPRLNHLILNFIA